jgi:tetratricopeptide (TPR) repeat protein
MAALSACTSHAPVAPPSAESTVPTAAPLVADYAQRNAKILFWESNFRENGTDDQISSRALADQYLQRYRETGDVNDVYRARSAANASIHAQPQGNVAAALTLADVDLTLHRFTAALIRVQLLERETDALAPLRIKEAGLDIELGRYANARTILQHIQRRDRDDAFRIVQSRFDEETGKLATAQIELRTAALNINSEIDAPAQRRAWFDFRLGEMAFDAGAADTARTDEIAALQKFPKYADAARALARIECAQAHWKACLDAASASAAEIPYPETLGLEADAQNGLGFHEAAQQTQDIIYAVERLGNAEHISDRLLAMEYSDHHLRPADAYIIAMRELTVRDDIYTEDTLAWSAAMAGRWHVAQIACRKALRFNTENALMQYHAGIIAYHFGDRRTAKYRFTRALTLNPAFHHVFAADARRKLAQIG